MEHCQKNFMMRFTSSLGGSSTISGVYEIVDILTVELGYVLGGNYGTYA